MSGLPGSQLICAVAPIDAILQLAALVPVFPCRAHEEKAVRRGRDVILGPKTPYPERGFYAGSRDPETIRAWWRQWPDALVGVPTGQTSGFIAVDYDAYKADAATDEWIANHTSELLSTRCHSTLKGGKHYLFIPPAGAHYRNGAGLILESKKRLGLDLRADGGYIIWWPLHGAQSNQQKAIELPAGLIDELRHESRAPLAALPSATPEKWKRDLGRLTFALAYLNPADYDEWIKVGFALHLHSNGADNGFELWNAWSAGEITGEPPSNYDGPDECRYRWASFHQDKKREGTVTVASLFKLAKERGYDTANIKPDPVQPIDLPSNVVHIGRKHDGKAPIEHESPKGSALVSWQSMALDCNSGGMPHANEANVFNVLRAHPNTAEKIWFDSFREEVYHELDGHPKPWTDHDSRRILLWMQADLKLSKFSKRMVDEGVLMYATSRSRNSVIEWIESEPWDGTPRLEEWLADFVGAPNDAHHRAAARNWIISMVARAYRPGCQVDHMLVLEGKEGRGKSSVLRALAAPWSVTLTQRFGSKEFTEAIQGNWLIELADLTALASANHSHILANITNPDDRYRAPWDRLASTHLRRCVFAGSTERHNDYLHDTYGIRRFWAVRCGHINVEALKAIRQQLFAEAAVQFKAGQTWHEMPEQTRQLQLNRVEKDDYLERISDYVTPKSETTALEVFEAVFVSRDDYGRPIGRTIMDPKDSARITKCLRHLNWYVVAAKRKGRKVNLWQPLPAGKDEPEVVDEGE